EMAGTLEEIRIRKGDVDGGRLALRRAVDEYDRAFRDYGINVGELEPAEAAQRIRARAVWAELAAALDDWALTRDAIDDPTAKRLLAITRAADPDPRRDAARAALDSEDRDELAKVAAKIVAPAGPDSLPPPTLTFLWMALVKVGDTERARDVLRQSRGMHPGDFWINHYLGIHSLLFGKQRQDGEEAVRFLSVALALRPQSAGAHSNLG